MKFSYNWLRELSKTKKSPEQLAEALTMHAFEVEGIEPFNTAQGKKDYIIDIDILANRGHDALSHVGMAREIAAIEGRKLNYRSKKLEIGSKGNLKVIVKDKKLCPRYIGVVMKNIKVQDSSQWIKARLAACGIQPINNIVDVTNYVLLELGQPMHAFDKKKLEVRSRKCEIMVRKAKKGEKIKLLDKTEKELTSEDLVIADSRKPIALAGVMGGKDTAIDELSPEISPEISTEIILECANFNPVSIRKSRIRHNLITESSDRFEKGIDPNLAEAGMARAVELIEKMGGKLVGTVDVYPKRLIPWKIKLDLNYVSKLLGEQISRNTIIKILKFLGIAGEGGSTSNRRLNLQIPTFRLDLKTQEDLIEEIGRIYGYEKIEAKAPVVPVITPPANEQRKFERVVKRILVGSGMSEVYNYSFYSKKDVSHADLAVIEHLELENPMNPDQELMRVSLIPNILKNVRENLKNYKELNIFEIGRIYWPASTRGNRLSTRGGTDKNVLPEEKRMLAAAVVIGDESKKATSYKLQATSFYEAKGLVDVLLSRLRINDYYFDNFDSSPKNTMLSLWHEGRSAEVKIENAKEVLGYVGEINPFILDNFRIDKRVAVFQFDLEILRKISQAEREYEPLRKYPVVERDISMVTSGDILVDDILRNIQTSGGNLVLDVDLFDIFDFEDGRSSYAFHIIFGADKKTLKSREVDELMKKIVENLEKDLGVEVRR